MDLNSSLMKQKCNEDKDMISKLPDFIIGRILSCLSTRDAVRTCVLSKRWIYLWTFINKVYLFDNNKKGFHGFQGTKIRKNRFIHCVYRILDRLDTLDIQIFTLFLFKSYNSSHIDEWISTLLCRGIKDFYINSTKKLDISSNSLWKSESLEKLNFDTNGCIIKLPTFICLSSLTYLTLRNIIFICHPINLSLNFPLLRTCNVENCIWLNVTSVTFEVPLLDHIFIKQTQELELGYSPTTIKFSTQHLTHFAYYGYVKSLLPDSILLDLDLTTTHITFASIYLEEYGEQNEENMTIVSSKLLKQFNNNVEFLLFEPAKVLALVQDDLPTFGMLSSLELRNVAGDVVLDILRNTSFLKTLVLMDILEFDEGRLTPENVPSYFPSKLEVVEFRNLTGVEHELKFIRFVLKYAEVLKNAVCSPRWDVRKSAFKKIIRRNIVSLEESITSPCLEIEFIL